MKCFIMLMCLIFPSCSMYTLNIEKPDGTKVEGRAFVFNNSESVYLGVESEDFKASFGKEGTDGTAQAQVVTDTVGNVLRVLPSL